VARAAPGEVLILWVARIVREKGLDTFVKALTLLHKRQQAQLRAPGGATIPPFRVLVAGTGPDLTWLQAALPGGDAPRPDTPRVTYLGHAGGGGLATALASADIFFFPSRTEVFPNNIAEAMASGLAVVVEDVGVVRALVRHNVTGILVPPAARHRGGDATAHADALAALAADAGARARLGAAAAASTRGLTWRRAVGALVRGYDACAAARRARSSGASAAVSEYILDGGADADALIYRIGVNLTGRYQHPGGGGTGGGAAAAAGSGDVGGGSGAGDAAARDKARERMRERAASRRRERERNARGGGGGGAAANATRAAGV
jgi:hypothetical protein